MAESQQLKPKWQTEVGKYSKIPLGHIPLNSEQLFTLNLFNNVVVFFNNRFASFYILK